MYSKTILKAVQILTTYVLHPPTLYHIPFCAIALAPFLYLRHSICILFNYFNSFKEIFCFQTSLFCFEETNLKKWAFNKQRTFTILTYFKVYWGLGNLECCGYLKKLHQRPNHKTQQTLNLAKPQSQLNLGIRITDLG